MQVALSPILAIALIFGLAACAERGPSGPPSPSAPATLAPAKAAPPPALGGEVESGARPAAPPPLPDATPEGAASPEDDASAEDTAPTTSREPSEADVADCYRYARATIDHDRRIERDRGDAGGFGSLGGDVGAFSDQLSRVGEGSTFQRAYDSCMSSKGYAQQ